MASSRSSSSLGNSSRAYSEKNEIHSKRRIKASTSDAAKERRELWAASSQNPRTCSIRVVPRDLESSETHLDTSSDASRQIAH
jgi:hypothetical protein